ncbi:MAG TPA: YHYH domain-containing protein [Anaerolineales bacterium]|nr:YHYH domain-containing protein [Anaerolineales bacterium]
MKMHFWIFILMMFFAGPVFAHGGGLDKCGGHRDKKQGGYHVHDHAKYCACYPQSENCAAKESRERKPEQGNKPVGPGGLEVR